MKVTFPNSAWVSALERLILARGRLTPVRLKVRYGIVVHPDHGVVLIDTGYTPHAVQAVGRSFMLRLYSRILAPVLNPAQQPVAMLASMGYRPEDVRTVIVTHFHADHVSGLRDFTNAQFVIDAKAWAQVRARSSLMNIKHGVFTELLPDDFKTRTRPLETCNLIAQGRDIFDDGSLVAAQLPGHAAGHFGVWINSDTHPVFYAVDAQWLRLGATENGHVGYPARLIMDDYGAFKRSSDTVADLLEGGHAVVFCHDPEDGPYDVQDRAL